MAETLMVVGSLNRPTPPFEHANGVGLSVLAFDGETGRLRLVAEERSIDNPTFLCADPATSCVYATSEVPHWHEGTVTAYRYDPARRRLVYVNKQTSLGSVAAHCSLDAASRTLLVANYGGVPEGEGPDRAIAALPLGPDGRLGAASASVAHRGRGTDPERQERPHPHCVLPSPDGRFVVVADLGLDLLASYRWGPDGLSPEPVAVTRLPDGSGPRHLAFGPDGGLALLVCELASTVSSLRFDAATGGFAVIDTVPALPASAGLSHASDIRVHPGGRRVYAANRGHDSIVDMALDPATGRLAVMGHRACGGRTPRNLALDPAGRHLLVANQNGDAIAVFRLAGDGALGPQVELFPIGTPMCIAVLGPG